MYRWGRQERLGGLNHTERGRGISRSLDDDLGEKTLLRQKELTASKVAP